MSILRTQEITRIKKELEISRLLRCKRGSFDKADRLHISLPKVSNINDVKNRMSISRKQYASNTYSSNIDYSGLNITNESNMLNNNVSVNISNLSDYSNHSLNSNVNNYNINKSENISDDTFGEFEIEKEVLL